jgi:hypothetical protein
LNKNGRPSGSRFIPRRDSEVNQKIPAILEAEMPFRRIVLNNFFYLYSALRLTKLAINDGATDDDKKACVFGAIAASVAFLECSINGLYEHSASHLGRMTNYRRLLASVFHEKLKFANLPWLTKYQVALALAHKPTFELGKEPYQSAELLNQLRNELIHPKEIYLGLNERFNEETQKSALEKRLTGRFSFNPARSPEPGELVGDEFLPERCLSIGCATWAVATAAKFYHEFERHMPATAYFFMTPGHAKHVLAELKKLQI